MPIQGPWAQNAPASSVWLRDRPFARLIVAGFLLAFSAAPAWANSSDAASISLSQSVDYTHHLGDAKFESRVTLSVANNGNETLTGVQVVDDLKIFGDGEIRRVHSRRVLSGNLKLNRNFDGDGDVYLLSGEDALAPGEEATITFKLVYKIRLEHGPFSNTAHASGLGQDSGNSAESSATELITLPIRPAATFSNTTSSPVRNDDGTYTFSATLDAVNIGNEDVVGLQFKYDLNIFGAGNVTNVGIPEVLRGDLTLNSAFNGTDEIRMLTREDVLKVGERATVRFEVTFDPAGEPGPFVSDALFWFGGAITGVGVDIWDKSTISIAPGALVELTKEADSAADNGGGTLSVPVRLRIRNLGDEPLSDIQLIDNYDIFGQGTLVDIVDLASDDLTVNPGFDGVLDQSVLVDGERLDPGTVATITFTVIYDPGPEPGPFTSTAVVDAVGEDSGTPTSDSADVTIPGFPTQPGPGISLSNVAGTASDNGDGSLSVPILLTVRNTGDEPLISLELEDNLDIFGSGELLSIENLNSDLLTVNAGFDGINDIDLLTGADTLPVGGAATVSFVARYTTGDEQEPFDNPATTRGIGEMSGIPVSDSDTARLPVAAPLPVPAIDVVKSVTNMQVDNDGVIDVEFLIAATNVGNEDLEDLQLVDDLGVLGNVSAVDVTSLFSATGTVNGAYDGNADIRLLSGADPLPMGQTVTVLLAIRFDPGTEPGPFANAVTGTATSVTTGTPVSDTATVDLPNVPVQPGPGIALTNTAGTATDNGDGSLSVPILLTVRNTGDETLESVELEDSLDIFGTGELLSVEDLASDRLTVNVAYDGMTDIDLLAGTDSMPAGDTSTVSFVVRYATGDEQAPFYNPATARGVGEVSGILVSATDAAQLPLTAPVPMPAIDVEKIVTDLQVDGDGIVDIEFSITATNTGIEDLGSLQLADDLGMLGNVAFLSISSLTSDTATVNPDFDGVSDDRLLAGADVLPVSGTANIVLVVRFDPGPETGPFINGVTATATSLTTGTPVIDTDEVSFGGSIRATSTGLSVIKVADREQVVRGDLVGYEILVTNLTSSPLPDIIVQDQPPPGFSFVAGSASLSRAGPDGVLRTADDVTTPIDSIGAGPIDFDPFDLSPGEAVLLGYYMRIGTGLASGEYINSVVVNDFPATPPGQAPILVVDDPIFEKTTLIGKVFDDRNRNGEQDDPEREPGIPGVRLATVAGLVIETDAFGRYHLADVEVDRFERGANFIIKIVETSLPDGTEFISDQTRVIRLTQATMSKVNFAVRLPHKSEQTCVESCSVEVRELVHRVVATDLCEDVQPYNRDWLSGPTQPSVVDPAMDTCTLSEAGPNAAEARQVTVSGGQFGCGTLIAETLPGRFQPRHSDITVFARENGNGFTHGADCDSFFGANAPIRAGMFPIEVTTEHDTVLWINAAGDVIRKNEARNFEHIVVTPFRDNTDDSLITALRVINDGADPSVTDPVLERGEAAVMEVKSATADPFFTEPRLDVLALGRTEVTTNDVPAEAFDFAIYTNYSTFIDRYVLEVFGSSRDGFHRDRLAVDEFSEYVFDQPRRITISQSDLARYDELQYVLNAIECDEENETPNCNDRMDTTVTRVLDANRRGADDELHHRNELWGQTNLERQNIRLTGGRVRVSGEVDDGDQPSPIDGLSVPAAVDGDFAFEKLFPAGTYEFRAEPSAGSGEDLFRSADANNVTVSGGLFGCAQVSVANLPGRFRSIQDKLRGDPDAPGSIGPGYWTVADERTPTVTVAANPDAASGDFSQCAHKNEAGAFPIEITTAEGTRLYVTAAGDVIQHDLPGPDGSPQQLVVTPFRDHTNSGLVTALRISNEGFHRQRFSTPARPGTFAEISEDQWFAVGLANLTVGSNKVTGNTGLLAADPHFDGSAFVDGRLAFYGKGKIQDKYLVTAQLDSTEDELKNFTDNLRRKDPRRIFRQLDPNLYYPIYGDDSTTTSDVDTQGAFYARVDWDRNTALWGNFNTGLTDTEIMQYNRSLYGAIFDHKSQSATEFGDETSKVKLFASEAQSATAHVTFEATGGSLYYLRHTDIVMGSEKVWIEVRRRDSERVVERIVMIHGRDYEVDALQGRILLRQPLSQVVNDRERSIIRSSPLEGDKVYLLVDYEYVPPLFDADDLTYGGQGRLWVGDHIGIGGTAVIDERGGTDYRMDGIDLTLRYDADTFIRAEFAESQARQSEDNYVSVDGGLDFQLNTSGGTGEGLEGEAIAIEAGTDLFGDSELVKADINGWWKTRDAEFSTGRIGQGDEVNDSGVELHASIGGNLRVAATYTDFEREQESREQVARVQTEGEIGAVSAGFEIRHEKIDYLGTGPVLPVIDLSRAAGDGEALLVGGRLGMDILTDTNVYASAQTVADSKGAYVDNDLYSVGVNTGINENLDISVEASDGDRGSALVAGVDFATDNGLNFSLSGGVGSGAISQFATRYAIGDGHELYGTYAVDPDRTEAARNLLTLGQRKTFGNGVGLFTESQFGKDDRYASVGHVFGLDFKGKDDWRFNASVQASKNEAPGEAFERQALSFGAFLNQQDVKFSSRIELREDEGAGIHHRQYVSSTSFTQIPSEDWRWIGQLNVSWTDDELNGGHNAKFAELDLGAAIRPAGSDKWNILTRYSFLYDLPTEGQATTRTDERSHLVSVEGIFDPMGRWELAAKLAARKGELREMRDAGEWREFGLRLASLRARYQATDKWDGVAEYRWLSDLDGDNQRHGALVALYRDMNDHLKVGVGFNFTDFDDNLQVDSYDHSGWFIDIVGKY